MVNYLVELAKNIVSISSTKNFGIIAVPKDTFVYFELVDICCEVASKLNSNCMDKIDLSITDMKDYKVADH